MPELDTQLDTPTATSLTTQIIDRIVREGPISFYDWMQSALYTPELGYYMRSDRQRWGREGDYRTSPERSELFAQTLAGYFGRIYDALEQPKQFTIVECGAGDGTFAQGVLSNLRERLPHVFEATQYLVDEISADSVARIRTRLCEFADRVDFVLLSEVAKLDAALVFSNELLDAFPVHRLQVIRGELRELHVSVDADGSFCWVDRELSNGWLRHFVERNGFKLKETQIIEVNPRIETWFENLARTVKRGYVVTVDYGCEANDLYDFSTRPEGTLRAYNQHRFENALACPGDFDITTSVDWTHVQHCGRANGFTVTEFWRLDQFLMKAGLLDELSATLTGLNSDSQRFRLTTAAREMILPGGMASSFQVLVQRRG